MQWKVSNLEKMGLSVMTSVQKESIPVVLSGHDVLIRSQTGSGKLQPIIYCLFGVRFS